MGEGICDVGLIRNVFTGVFVKMELSHSYESILWFYFGFHEASQVWKRLFESHSGDKTYICVSFA